MRLALIVLIALVGVSMTVLSCVRMWRAQRAGAQRELVLGYLAIMVLVSVLCLLALRTI